MATWYRAIKSGRIVPCEVTRNTTRFVWVKTFNGDSYKTSRESAYDRYCSTWEEARRWLSAHADNLFEWASGAMREAVSFRKQINALTPPEEGGQP